MSTITRSNNTHQRSGTTNDPLRTPHERKICC